MTRNRTNIENNTSETSENDPKPEAKVEAYQSYVDAPLPEVPEADDPELADSSAESSVKAPKRFFDDLDKVKAHIDYSTEVLPAEKESGVPCGRPNRDHFIRVHPGEEFRLDAYLVDYSEDTGKGVKQLDTYFMMPGVGHDGLFSKVKLHRIYVYIDEFGTVGLWQTKLTAPGQKDNDWNKSAKECAAKLMRAWGRLESTGNAYVVQPADPGVYGEPAWPVSLNLGDLLESAFAGYVIDRDDHHILRKLRGQER